MLSDKIAQKIAGELQLDREKQAVIRYGAFMLIQVLVALVLSLVLGYFLGILIEVLIVSLSANILRQYSGGAHASKPSICLIIGTTVTIVMAYAAHQIAGIAQTGAVFAAGIVVFVWVFNRAKKYIPVDSKAKPIVSIKKKAKMRKISFVILACYAVVALGAFIASLFIKDQRLFSFSISLYAGVIWQTSTLTITGRKILAYVDSFLDAVFFQKRRYIK